MQLLRISSSIGANVEEAKKFIEDAFRTIELGLLECYTWFLGSEESTSGLEISIDSFSIP